MKNLPTPLLLNKYHADAVVSAAMDGAAPDLGRDAPWREEQRQRGTSRAQVLFLKACITKQPAHTQELHALALEEKIKLFFMNILRQLHYFTARIHIRPGALLLIK